MDLKDIRKQIEYLDECYVDAPTVEAGHSIESVYRDLVGALGMCRGLLVAVEAAVASRPVVTIINGKPDK